MDQNGNTKQGRRHYSPDQKMKILREHLKEQISLSELSEKYEIHVNALYQWEKQLFESGSMIFTPRQNGKVSVEKKENEKLKEKLKSKDRLISELVEENIGLKKNSDGEI